MEKKVCQMNRNSRYVLEVDIDNYSILAVIVKSELDNNYQYKILNHYRLGILLF